MRRIALFLFWLAPAVLAASWETDAYRTDSGRLVRPGMTMTEVRRDAGEPRERVVLSRGVNVGLAAGETTQV